MDFLNIAICFSVFRMFVHDVVRKREARLSGWVAAVRDAAERSKKRKPKLVIEEPPKIDTSTSLN
jgi:hypothetical protein